MQTIIDDLNHASDEAVKRINDKYGSMELFKNPIIETDIKLLQFLIDEIKHKLYLVLNNDDSVLEIAVDKSFEIPMKNTISPMSIGLRLKSHYPYLAFTMYSRDGTHYWLSVSWDEQIIKRNENRDRVRNHPAAPIFSF